MVVGVLLVIAILVWRRRRRAEPVGGRWLWGCFWSSPFLCGAEEEEQSRSEGDGCGGASGHPHSCVPQKKKSRAGRRAMVVVGLLVIPILVCRRRRRAEPVGGRWLWW